MSEFTLFRKNRLEDIGGSSLVITSSVRLLYNVEDAMTENRYYPAKVVTVE